MEAPAGWKVPRFYKSSGENYKTTRERISMFVAQLGEASIMEQTFYYLLMVLLFVVFFFSTLLH
jgi:hypothetical protein